MILIKKLGVRLNKNENRISYALFLCLYCLKEVVKQLGNGLKAKSCGCIHNKKQNNNMFKHGETKTRLHNIWGLMKQRCLNIKNKNYPDYGGRGITICPEWTDKLNGYINFRDWALNKGYSEGLQINRIFNDGNYEPSNCNWIPQEENKRNTRRKVIKNMEIANEIRELYKTDNYTQKELAIKFNVKQNIISQIINNKRWKGKNAFILIGGCPLWSRY